MNFEYFIAKRLQFYQKGKEKKKNVSRPAVRIAAIGITVGLAVMIVAVSVVIGFKKEIRNKTIGFGAHIQITNFDSNNTYEMTPITLDSMLLENIDHLPTVAHTQPFITKPGIIKTNDEFQGIVLKGVDEKFDWDFFNSNIVEGKSLSIDNDSIQKNNALISSSLAKLLKLKLGDTFLTYFIQDRILVRKFKITGIYSTNFAEYDNLFVLTDLRIVQRLNKWNETQISGLEVLIDDFSHLDNTYTNINDICANQFSEDGNSYMVTNIKQSNPQIFGWLSLMDINVWVILILMLLVAGFNMISGLMILILERTNTIGILKSYGANNWSIRKIFLYQSIFLIGKSMIWGNVVGLTLCFLQYQLRIIPLDPASYYVSTVPITFDWFYLILLNIGTFIASILMLVVPSYLIARISPAKIMRYE